MSTTPRFIPNEVRDVAERSVEQAKLAFNSYMRATEKAVSAGGVEAGQVGALDISKKAMSFARLMFVGLRTCPHHHTGQ